MIVYAVDCQDGEPRVYFATKRAALASARELAHEVTPPGEVCTVERVELVPMTKEAIVRLLNVEGRYEDTSTVVANFPSTREESAS
jgi:hypothetical protein